VSSYIRSWQKRLRDIDAALERDLAPNKVLPAIKELLELGCRVRSI
jgi:hypothetical protein